MCVRSDCVRHKCPVRASYSRHVLPPVVGFPHLRVRCVIRHPSGLRWACPLTVLLHLPAWQESLGLPTVFDVSLPACHGLRTPADLPILANADRVVLPSGAFKPSASAIAMSKLSQHCRVRGHPYGLQDTLSTRRPSCSPWSNPQLRHGRKTRYGWVASPFPTGTCTLLETPSFLGARTLALTCCRKRERSGRCRQSAAVLGSAGST